MASRVYVQSSIAEPFIAALKQGFEDLSRGTAIGDPSKPDTQVGPLADKAQYSRVMEFLEIGKREGSLVTGGVRRGDKGTFVEPTIFRDVADGSRIVKEEVFGPVVTVKTFATEEEGVALANDTVFGLSGAWSTVRLLLGSEGADDSHSLCLLEGHQPRAAREPGARGRHRSHQ